MPAASAQNIERWIDLEQFAALNGTLCLLVEVAPLFTRQTQAWLASFDAATTAGDQAAVLQLLHKMKGSCAGIGATRLAHDIRSTDQLVRDSGLGSAQASLHGLGQELHALNQALAAWSTAQAGKPA